MGELLRSAYAKRLVNQHQVVLRSKALCVRQWGISLPGACASGAAPLSPWWRTVLGTAGGG